MNELNPDLFPAQEIERFIKGLPADPEFGPLKPFQDGCRLDFEVTCPPNGEQKLEISLEDSDSITPIQRGILHAIKREWPAIWSGARSAWFKEYPAESDDAIHQRQWILECTVFSDTTLREEYDGLPVWQLSISGNVAVTIVCLTMQGSTVLDSELI